MKLTFLFIQVVLCLLLLAALEQGRVEAKTTTTTKRSKTTTDSTKAPKSTTTTKKSKTTTSPSFNCPTSNNNGVYADPDDCTHYYVCKDGEATNQACGPVLSVFDPNMGRCRLPVFIPSCIVVCSDMIWCRYCNAYLNARYRVKQVQKNWNEILKKQFDDDVDGE